MQVLDTTLPTIECIENITITDLKMIDLSQVLQYSDNCQVFSTSQNATANSTMDVGIHYVNFIVTDSSGNKGECTILVQVKEVEKQQDIITATTSSNNGTTAGMIVGIVLGVFLGLLLLVILAAVLLKNRKLATDAVSVEMVSTNGAKP